MRYGAQLIKRIVSDLEGKLKRLVTDVATGRRWALDLSPLKWGKMGVGHREWFLSVVADVCNFSVPKIQHDVLYSHLTNLLWTH